MRKVHSIRTFEKEKIHLIGKFEIQVAFHSNLRNSRKIKFSIFNTYYTLIMKLLNYNLSKIEFHIRKFCKMF